jgi:thiol-disulfide isomerase/thioredoxin
MKIFRLFIPLLAPLFLFTNCKKSDQDIVTEIEREMGNHQSVHFKITRAYHYSNQPDTTITEYEVWAVKDPKDTLRNGYVAVDNYYRPYHMIYDQGNFYLAIPPKKTTILYSVYDDDFISPTDWIDVFLNPNFLKDQIFSEAVDSTAISDIEYQGKACKKIEISFIENEQGEKKSYTYIVSKKQFVPLWAQMKSENKERVYVNELNFSDFEFDKVNLPVLKERQENILSVNPVEPEGTDSEVARLERMLHIGEDAPLFEGVYYGTGEIFKLEDHIGKSVIVVDFWYTHCPPCVKAMPALSEFYSQYKDQGVKIFGLNSVDNQPRSLDNLDHFLAKRQLSYDVIMTQPEVDINYKINGYPTMYVVDKSGRVSFVEIGYDEAKFEAFKKHVEKLLED